MKLNIANSKFEGFNDQRGIMICGYEWGNSKKDQKRVEQDTMSERKEDAECTFSNKALRYGKDALDWPYDNRIIHWFELWGHPLCREGLGKDFDKCIVQTNWCNTGGNKMEGDYYQKLTAAEQINNFIFHIKEFNPALILFMGSEMIHILNKNKEVLKQFSDIMGEPSQLKIVQKEFPGTSFKVGFQTFDRCEIVSLPHPSPPAPPPSPNYIALFKPEIASLIANVKQEKNIS